MASYLVCSLHNWSDKVACKALDSLGQGEDAQDAISIGFGVWHIIITCVINLLQSAYKKYYDISRLMPTRLSGPLIGSLRVRPRNSFLSCQHCSLAFSAGVIAGVMTDPCEMRKCPCSLLDSGPCNCHPTSQLLMQVSDFFIQLWWFS